MNRILFWGVCFLGFVQLAGAADLATASSQKLLAIYAQLRTIQAGAAASCENVVLVRDAATFTFISGRITFSAPISGRVLAARFEGEGKFELQPPSAMDRRQVRRFSGADKLADTFREAIFYFTDDTYDQLSKQLKIQPVAAELQSPFAASQREFAENFNDWVENRHKGNPAMRNIPARMLADLTDNSSKGFFLANFKAKTVGDLLFHISWNRDPVLLPDYARGEEITLLHINPGNYYEWWAGFHLASEYQGSKHPDHRETFVKCATAKIDLQISKDNEISAVVQMEYTAQAPARVLPFILNGVLRINSIEDAAGAKLSFIQEDRRLDSDPWLILAEPARPGETKQIKIAYKEDATRDSRIVSQRGAGLFYVTSRESWFPSFGAFDDRTQFEINVRSPKKYKLVASGSLLSSRKDKDDLVTCWKSDIPLSVVGFNYGEFVEATQSLPNLSITAYSGKELPEELKSLEKDLDVAELASRRTFDEGGRNVEAENGILRGGFNTAQSAGMAAGISAQAFRLYEFLFGQLPFKSISVTEQPIRGYGQSWPNLIFLPYDSLLDATTRNSLRLQKTASSREFYNTVAVHEMAHQWWGHLVGWKTYHDQWLSEGIAEFSSALYLQQFAPKQLRDFWELKRTRLLSKNSNGYRPVDAGSLWLNTQLDTYSQNQNSTDLIYYKGAYVLEMLRALMFDPRAKNGDSRFMEMMHDFASTYSGKNVSTDDFRRLVEKHTNRSMEWFFDQWVYGTDIPKYDFSYKLNDLGDGKTEVAFSLSQLGVPESYHMELPLFAVINGEQRYLGVLGVTGTKPVQSSIKLPMRPEKMVLDPNLSILAEINQ